MIKHIIFTNGLICVLIAHTKSQSFDKNNLKPNSNLETSKLRLHIYVKQINIK